MHEKEQHEGCPSGCVGAKGRFETRSACRIGADASRQRSLLSTVKGGQPVSSSDRRTPKVSCFCNASKSFQSSVIRIIDGCGQERTLVPAGSTLPMWWGLSPKRRSTSGSKRSIPKAPNAIKLDQAAGRPSS